MAKILVNRRRKTYRILDRTEVGPSHDIFYMSSLAVPGANAASILTLQATVYSDDNPPESAMDGALSRFDWASAPPWAKYAAINEDGKGNWFKLKPILDECRGIWNSCYVQDRTWPMCRNTHLYRCWTDTLEDRPLQFPAPTPPAPPCSCNCSGNTHSVSDAISYIQVGLRNMSVCSSCCCYCTPAPAPIPATDPVVDPVPAEPVAELSAQVLVEGSNDGISWLALGSLMLQGPDLLSDGFASPAAWGLIRGSVVSLEGPNPHVLITMGV